MRRFRSGLATTLIVLSFVIALVPLVLVVVYIASKGAKVISWDFLTGDIPFSTRSADGGIGPAIVGTIVITARRDADGGAARRARRHLPQRVRRASRSSRRSCASCREILTGVPSIVMGLFIYTFWVLRLKEQTGFAGSLALGVPHAPGRDPHVGGDAAARAARAARGEPGAREPQVAHDPHRRAAARGPGDRERRRCSRSPGPRARRRRCCSPSARPRPRTGTSSRARTTRSSLQIFGNANSRRSCPRRSGRSVPRSP